MRDSSASNPSFGPWKFELNWIHDLGRCSKNLWELLGCNADTIMTITIWSWKPANAKEESWVEKRREEKRREEKRGRHLFATSSSGAGCASSLRSPWMRHLLSWDVEAEVDMADQSCSFKTTQRTETITWVLDLGNQMVFKSLRF
jgi:hypothetical protein